MDSKRKLFNLGSGIMALFVVGLLLGATMTTAWAEQAPTIRGEGAKDISGSFVTTHSPYIAPGSSGTWTFLFWNKSIDGELLDEVTLDFPAGITVTNSSSCTILPDTTTRYLQTDGNTGDGVVVTWSDPNAGSGEIDDFEVNIATVTVSVDGGFSGNVVINTTMSGDGTGGGTHDIAGSVTIPEHQWVKIDQHAPFSVTGDFTNVLVMEFIMTDDTANDWLDAITLVPGIYDLISPAMGPTWFDNVVLWHDVDGDGVLDAGTGDTNLGPFAWDGNSWVLSGLGAMSNSPVTTTGDRYFVTVDIASAAPDDGIISFMIPYLQDAGAPGVFDAGDEGWFTVGGDVGSAPPEIYNIYAQIVNRYSVMADYTINDVIDPDWVGPVHSQVLILDFEVPDNWTLADDMTAITFFNNLDADTTDLINMQLWRDDGTPGWNDGGETVVGVCVPDTLDADEKHWYLDLSATPESIPHGGARFFLTADISDSAADGHVIQMGIPQWFDDNTNGEFDQADNDEGAFFASRNDGPQDGPLVNGDFMIIDSGPPVIDFADGVGDGIGDANAYGSYVRQTTITDAVLAVGTGHSIDSLKTDTNNYGVSWAAMEWSKTIKWSVVYDETIPTADKWVVAGVNADGTAGGPGAQTARAEDGVDYWTDGNEIFFILTEGTLAAEGDSLFFYTTRNIVGLENPELVDTGGEAPGDEVQDELDKDEIIVSVDGITDGGSGIASVRIYCTFDNSDPTTAKTTVKDMFNVAAARYWTNGATPDNILPSEVTDGNLVKFIVRAIDNVGNVAESEIQMCEIDDSPPSNMAPTFTWNTDNTLLPPNVVNIGDVLNLNVDMVAQEVPSFTEIAAIKCDVTALLNATSITFYDLAHTSAPYNGHWTFPVTIADGTGNTGKDDSVELPAGLSAVVQIFDHIGNMDLVEVWNVADNSNFNGFDNFTPETPPPTVALDQDNTTTPANTVNIGDVVQVEVACGAVDDTGILEVTVDMQAYGSSYGAAEPLNDGGYDGDDIAGDGIWSREFLVEDAGGAAVDQLNLDNTVSAILTDDAGNPDITPEMIAAGNTLDIDTAAPVCTFTNFDFAINLGGVNWLDYFGDPDIANPGDRVVVRWDAAADGETDDLLSIVCDLTEIGGPAENPMVVDEGGQEGGSFNDWDGDHGVDLELYGVLWDFVEGSIDDDSTYSFLTVTDNAGNVTICTTGVDEGPPAEPLSVDVILPLGSLTVTIGHHANPPKSLYAGINDTLFFTFDASATTPFDVIPPNGGVAVDLTDFGFPFQTTPLVLTRGTAPDTMKWYGEYEIVGAGNVGVLGPEIAVDKDIDFEATVYDNALNEFVDNFGEMIHCDNTTVVEIMSQYTSCWITHDLVADDIAAIGDTLWFGFDNTDATGQDVGDIRNNVAGVYVDTDRDGEFEVSDLQLTDPDEDEIWVGYHVVTDSTTAQPWTLEDTTKSTFGFYAMDNGMNTSMTMAPCADSVFVDNVRPVGTLDNSSVADITSGTVQKVSVGDILTAKYDLDRINDNVTVLLDLQAYGYGASESLGATLQVNFTVADVDDPDYLLDVLPGNALIDPTMEICVSQDVTDNAGNTYSPTCYVPFDSDLWGVDNDAPVTATPTVVMLDDHDFKGNGMVNFGDRIDILCNMAGYPDMAGGEVLVNLYGYGGNSSDDVDAGLILTDDAFSEGGEGDLEFSFVLAHAAYPSGYRKGFVVGSGPDGAPGVKGVDDDLDGQIDNPEELFWPLSDDMAGYIDTDAPAECTNPPAALSAIEAKAFDDDGCPAGNTEDSAEFTQVVDTQQPGLDDADVEFFDSDVPGEPGHGIVNIGDTLVIEVEAITDVGLVTYDHYGTIPVTVDMSAYGYSEVEPISTVAETTAWGAPLTWTRSFLVVEGDDGIDVGASHADSKIDAWGWDDADNWQLSPTTSSAIPFEVDSEMPDGVQNLTAAAVQGGRIKLEWDLLAKVGDYAYFHIYQGEPDSDLVDYTEPTESINPATTVWYSDTLMVGHTYLFGVRVEDDAGNTEQNTNLVSGKIPDHIIPYATLTWPPNGNLLVWGPDGAPGEANVDDDGANGIDDAGEVGAFDDYTFDLVATMSDNDVVTSSCYQRKKDADPLLEGDQPGTWALLGTVDWPGGLPWETFSLTIDWAAQTPDEWELISVPKDNSDNFPSHEDAYDFSHLNVTWDNVDPSLIYLMVAGDASPDAATLIPQGVIPMIVHAEDYGQSKAVPNYLKLSVIPNGYLAPVVAYENVAVTDWPHHFDINTTDFPDGTMDILLWLMDPSGNSYTMEAVTVTIEDVDAPVAAIVHPEYGDHITGAAYPIMVEPGLDAYGNPVSDIARVDAYYSEDGSAPWNWIGFDTTPEGDKSKPVHFMIPWNTTNLVHDDDYFLLCEITDNSSNMDTTETIMVVKDTTALPVEIHIDEIVMVNGEERVHGDSLKIEALASDPNIAQCTFEWRFAVDPDEDVFYKNIATDYSAPYWTLFNTENVGGSNWDQQNYPIVVRVKPKDTSGNDMLCITYDVIVDNMAPRLHIYSVNGFISSGDIAVMCGTDAEIVVHTPDDDVAFVRYEARIDGQPTIGIAQVTSGTLDPATGMYSYSATWTVPVINDDTPCELYVGGRDIIDNKAKPHGTDDSKMVTILGTETMTVLMAQPLHGTNLMGVLSKGWVKGTTGNTDVASASFQWQTPGETVWHTSCTDEEGPTWESTKPFRTLMFADGDMNMRWQAQDADENPDPNPVGITVTLDNTPPVAVIDELSVDKISREILLTAECSDADVGSFPATVQCVDFMVKEFTDDTGNYTIVGTDYTAPYEFMFDTRTVTDSRYHILAIGTDNAGFQYGFAGNTQDPTYAAYELLEIDNTGPANLKISDIGENRNPDPTGETLPQEEALAIIATSTDLDVVWIRFDFKHIDDIDYNEIDTDAAIEIIADQSTGTAVWNTTPLIPGDVYVVKVTAGDDVGNETVTSYDFKVGLPISLILSIDDETGEIVAECNETARLVKFDYQPTVKGKKSKSWEGIGFSAVDDSGYAKIIWHYEEQSVGDGTFEVRAWASDDSSEWDQGLKLPEDEVAHWTLTKTGNHFDIQQSTLTSFQLATPNDNSDPELIQVNVWVPSGYGRPSLYVVIDDAPNEPNVGPVDYEVALIPSANDPNLYEPDPDNQVRLTPIATGGVADFYATLPSISKGGMEVLTDQIVVAEVTLTDGGFTYSESEAWYVEIPKGALRTGADGLVARDVAVTPQSPAEQIHLKPIAGAVSVFMMSDYTYYFNSGYYATFVVSYEDTDLPDGFDEAKLSVSWWDGYYDEWDFDGLRIIDHDTENNILTFNADFFGGSQEGKANGCYGGTIYTLIANIKVPNQGTIEITDLVVLPLIDDVTWCMPGMQSFVTDEVSTIDYDEVEMWLDGVLIWDDDDAAFGWNGNYDRTSGELRVWWLYQGEYWYNNAPPLKGGEHEVTVTAMNEVENYWSVTDTFTVEYPHAGSIEDVIFLGNRSRLDDGVWYTDARPIIQANVHDPFNNLYYYWYGYSDYSGVRLEDLQVEIDGIEYAEQYAAVEWYHDQNTGTWGVMSYHQPEDLVGGEHTYDIIFTRNQVTYTYTGTFVVEYNDIADINPIWFEEPQEVSGGYTWTDDHPVIKANIADLFGTLASSDIELRIDGREYEHVYYECGSTGDAGIMTYTHPTSEGMLLSDGKHYFTIGVTMNEVAIITDPDTFMVDANEPVLSGYDGGYVGATPSITFTVSDLGVGVDTKTIHLDLFQMVQTTSPPNDVERKEYLYTAFPSMLAFATTGNDVNVSYSPVINLQDNEELEITLYGGTYTTSGYDSDDTGDRHYRDSDGITDKVGNVLTPATKRFIVDAKGPEAVESEVLEDGFVYYVFQDIGAGVTCDDIEITMDDEAFTDFECEQLTERTQVSVTFDPGDLGTEFKIKVTDGVGNFSIERFINETAEVALGEDAHCYPNPATGDKTTIIYNITKRTGVEVTIRIYDFAGEPVRTLYRGAPAKVGDNEVVWYFDDDNGKAVGRGAYLCRIVAKDDSKTAAKVVKIAVAKTY